MKGAMGGIWEDMYDSAAGAASTIANDVESAWNNFANAPTNSYGNDMYVYDDTGAPVNESLPELAGDGVTYVVDAAGNVIDTIEQGIKTTFSDALVIGGLGILAYMILKGRRHA